MTPISTLLLGDESLTIGCGAHLLERGHSIAAVVTGDAAVRDWAETQGLPVFAGLADLPGAFAAGAIDWLLSIANLTMIPDAVLALPAKGAVNFHDGPLPRYAGLNTPAWAIWNGEAQHGITWHLIAGGVDRGDILEQRLFDIAPDETAYTLNSKCYAAAMESFPALLTQLETGDLHRQPQDPDQRSYCARDDRPEGLGALDFTQSASRLARQVRALDFGGYRNPLATAKIGQGGTWLSVTAAEAEETVTPSAPGTVLELTAQGLRVATGSGVLHLTGLRSLAGRPVDPARLTAPGEVLTPAQPALDDTAARRAARADAHWQPALLAMHPAPLSLGQSSAKPAAWQRHELGEAAGFDLPLLAAVLLAFARISTDSAQAAIALATPEDTPDLLSSWVPLALDAAPTLEQATAALDRQCAALADQGPFAADLLLREPGLAGQGMPDIALRRGSDTPLAGSLITLTLPADGAPALHLDSARIPAAAADVLVARLRHILTTAAHAQTLADLTALPASERALLEQWNRTERAIAAPQTIHAAFEAQVARTPDATALVHDLEELTYAQLDARANALAARLQQEGVKPGSHVALCVSRGPLLLIGALAILKAGGAYVPLDPAYPADRLAHYVTDSRASVIVTEGALQASLPANQARIVLAEDAGDRAEPVDGGAGPDDLAYVIYTSGSTGTPKGVMVEHRNVANFFTGMDDVVDHASGGVWMAVTSLAFDISVLELFYTLARGFKLVLISDEGRVAVSNGTIGGSGRHADFSLYYWSNDCAAGRGKYELLLEGAKFADTHGFDALWTPERHFHAFGGPYPNPAVTGAAVAAITRNLAVRAGSIVAPLHHPARIAEEWAVIDNLTNGRTGLGIASGWHPDDFVLRPENAPPDNKAAMFQTVDQLRRLWRGEPVEFAKKSGEMVPVVTQPRPVSDDLKIWLTIAGNPETWRQAGEIGANVLTHLLGQSIEEVGEKITIYHQALRDNGYDPDDFIVTVMLHTLIGEDREKVRQTAKGPLKEYLAGAAGLVKQYAWTFPAFKRPEGVNNPFELDTTKLDAETVEAILDHAFDRYFYDSGLFGTVEDGIARVEQLKQLGVGEIACLIDYGIPNADVLEGLTHLAQVRERSNRAAELRDDDLSITAQIIRHGVTHMQCTPSMARMLTMNDEARLALGRLKHLYLGGEALPGSLVADLRRCTRAKITNMYGPTETTIWSAAEVVVGDGKGQAAMPLGRPIANTQLHVVGDDGRLAPIGAAGELLIGGAGVARGYWQRDDLTAERFVTDPALGQGRLYRSGDLVRWTADGHLGFLGRTDHQVKIRGQRIELGEIEARIGANPTVRDCVVVARDTPAGDPDLVAYVIATGPDLNHDVLRADLALHLPEVMLPRHFVTLERFPLTPNKKIDRKALPAPEAQAPRDTREAAAAPSGSAAAVARIWSRILGVAEIRASDSFFDLGGHSLLAVQAHREIRTEMEASKLSITDIFRFPRLDALAGHLDALTGVASPGPDDTPPDGAAEADRSETISRRRAMRAARGRRAG